jgi:ABC-type transporter Mla subunit MlaD
VALTAAVVALLLALRRTVQRAAGVLGIVEEELRPLIAQAHALTDEVRGLTREASLEVKRVGEVTEGLNAVAETVGRLAGAAAALTRVGQVVSLAAGVLRGTNVFLHRVRKQRGDHHG